MRAWRGVVSCILLLAAAAAAAEPDGAVADPARWTGPNGPASQSRRSRAMPVVRDVVEAWTADLPGEVIAPPVTWDGECYVLCTARKGHWLAAVDVARGRLLGKKMLTSAPRDFLHVWGGVVCLRTSDAKLSGCKRVGNSFVEQWKLDVPKFEGMAVLESEIYVVGGGTLSRFAPGTAKPLWSDTRHDARGTPSVFGQTVLALGRVNSTMHVYAFDRPGGEEQSSSRCGPGGASGNEYGITVSERRVLARTSGIDYAVIGASLKGDTLHLSDVQALLEFKCPPAVFKDGLLACAENRAWVWWRGEENPILAERSWTPDLFRPVLPPTVLGDVVYFGSWAADAETGEILWRLPVEARFGAVPADRIVIVVDAGGRLRAYRARVGG